MEPGLRERKKRETRLALSLAAVNLVAERGWENVTVDDIAAAANVSDRTFRNYFGSKAEAIASRHLDRTMQVVDDLRARPAEEPLWEAVIASVVPYYEAPAGPRSRRWADHIGRALAEPAVQGEVLRANAAAQAGLARAVAERTGTDAGELYPKLVAAAVMAGISVAIEQTLISSTPLTEILRDVFDQIARGLPAPH